MTEERITAFYDALAPDYDSMTGFEQRFAAERPHYRFLTERYHIATAVDAGAGTGFHSLLLSRLGVAVTAVDISGSMLMRLQAHAAAEGHSIRTLQSSLTSFASQLSEPVDAVFCLGNTLPHLTDPEGIAAALPEFHAALRPGGLVLLQMLNYDRILATSPRIQNIREAGTKTFIRFYDYTGDLITFHVTTIDRSAVPDQETDRSITLRPIRSSEIVSWLEKAGFTDIRLYGGIGLIPYEPATSQDLVVSAIRPH